MTREDIQAEIEHVTLQVLALREQMWQADGALQALQYMLTQFDKPPVEAKDGE